MILDTLVLRSAPHVLRLSRYGIKRMLLMGHAVKGHAFAQKRPNFITRVDIIATMHATETLSSCFRWFDIE